MSFSLLTQSFSRACEPPRLREYAHILRPRFVPFHSVAQLSRWLILCSGVNLMTRMLVTFPWVRDGLLPIRSVNVAENREVHGRIRIR